MDPEEAPPPPYSAVDPLLAQPRRNASALTEVNPRRLRGGNLPSPPSLSGPGIGSATNARHLPANFASAADYFVERPVPTVDEEKPILEHHLTIYPRSQAKDFPRRPRCWNPRSDDIAQQDWDMFLRYLFPPHLGLASVSGQLPRQLRAEIQRDRKDRPQETDEQRRMRVSAVVTEWNHYFFEPRAARLVYVYVTDPQSGPVSPLCPRCYPAATRASQENRTALVPQAGRGRPPSSPGPYTIPRQLPASSPVGNYPHHPHAYPHPRMPPSPYAPYGGPAYYGYASTPAPPMHGYPYQPQRPQPYPYNWPSPQHSKEEASKRGPLGWMTSLVSQAQKYGERIGEQAAQYGDHISAQAQHYGRQVEEQAMAHGRWIEEQAGLQGRKMESTPYPGYNYPHSDYDARLQAYYASLYGYRYPEPRHATVTPAEVVENPTPVETPPVQRAITAPLPTSPLERPRRKSTDSTSSDTSLSSIDSFSTTSDLSSSDLATVRAQLLSLDEQHGRDLHDAAVDLRRQLDTLRQSRQQARQPPPRSHWCRWDSPDQHQRSAADRRAIKEETRATRKAFRDVLRRARTEQRERRKMKHARRRQERRSQRDEAEASIPLDQRMQNLELDTNRESRSTVQSFASFPSRRSGAESEVSDISSVDTPSSGSSHVVEGSHAVDVAETKSGDKENQQPTEQQRDKKRG
ncbi:hypothetical protein BDW42DRAFT_177044 [Aspergillus taichungensis]|uniref:Uncharacterized protein n=1 Tax=Aspergillus taichungensis TaxID=482145 RepID=A0A2J5HJZ4_9EURO|nr:hypothetical protein BDW42DRAFT_177044 [Aspergillus taichungensis]